MTVFHFKVLRRLFNLCMTVVSTCSASLNNKLVNDALTCRSTHTPCSLCNVFFWFPPVRSSLLCSEPIGSCAGLSKHLHSDWSCLFARSQRLTFFYIFDQLTGTTSIRTTQCTILKTGCFETHIRSI